MMTVLEHCASRLDGNAHLSALYRSLLSAFDCKIYVPQEGIKVSFLAILTGWTDLLRYPDLKERYFVASRSIDLSDYYPETQVLHPNTLHRLGEILHADAVTDINLAVTELIDDIDESQQGAAGAGAAALRDRRHAKILQRGLSRVNSGELGMPSHSDITKNKLLSIAYVDMPRAIELVRTHTASLKPAAPKAAPELVFELGNPLAGSW